LILGTKLGFKFVVCARTVGCMPARKAAVVLYRHHWLVGSMYVHPW